MSGLSVFNDGKQVIVVMPLKEAVHLGALLDACLDTAGNIEGRDIDLTNKQVSKAEDNMIALSTKLMELDR